MENLGGGTYTPDVQPKSIDSLENAASLLMLYTDALLVVDTQRTIDYYAKIADETAKYSERKPIIKGLDIRGGLLSEIVNKNFSGRSSKLEKLTKGQYSIATAMGIIAYALEIKKWELNFGCQKNSKSPRKAKQKLIKKPAEQSN